MMFMKRILTICFLRLNNPQNPLCRFSTSRRSQCQPQVDQHFMVEYLVNSCGISKDKATKCARHLTPLKSTRNPESVLGFFRTQGFDDAQIKKLVTRWPKVLCSSVENTLAPKLKAMQDFGFPQKILVRMILNNTTVLGSSISTVQKAFGFWKGFAAPTTPDFFAKYRGLFSCNFEKNNLPNIRFLQSLGVSNDSLAKMMRLRPDIIMRRHDSMKEATKQVVEMGLPSSSRTFAWAVAVRLSISEARFKTNVELMKSFGWSETEIISALCKNPTTIGFSEKMLRLKVDYLVKNVGLDASYLIRNPVILSYSLDKRIIPRHNCMEILRSRGLKTQSGSALTYILATDKKFIEKFILPYIDEAPELNEMYNSVVQGRKCL